MAEIIFSSALDAAKGRVMPIRSLIIAFVSGRIAIGYEDIVVFKSLQILLVAV